MSEETPGPFPTALGAVAVTGLAWALMVIVTGLAAPGVGITFALALGSAAGLGGIGTVAARNVPPPTDRRLGLVGFAPELVLPVLLLVPHVLLVSELDNWVAAAFPPPTAGTESADVPLDGLFAVELVLYLALLRPVVEEFFFRGVVQQGTVETLGARRGVLLTALLFALFRTTFGVSSLPQALSLVAQGFCEGLLLGGLRLASGSIAPGMILSMLAAGSGLFAIATQESLPIPGFNDGSGHTPLVWLVPAALSVAAGVAWLWRAHQRYPATNR